MNEDNLFKEKTGKRRNKYTEVLWKYKKRQSILSSVSGGWSEIRTHGGRKPSTVFKTVAFNRSAIHPLKTLNIIRIFFEK